MLAFAAAGALPRDRAFAIRPQSPGWGWRYSQAMIVAPICDMGWHLPHRILLPPLVVWVVPRQVRASAGDRS